MIPKWGSGTMVLPAPVEVDHLMRSVLACPMVTGIFAWIAANAAEELLTMKPKARSTPYWRTLKTGGLLNDKYPGGVKSQKQKLQAEGHRVVKKGKNLAVANLEDRLFTFRIQ